MDYRPLTFPIPDDIAADLCDPGSPPPGHVRLVLTKCPNTPVLVSEAGPRVVQDLTDMYTGGDGDVEYCVGVSMQEVLRLLPEYNP